MEYILNNFFWSIFKFLEVSFGSLKMCYATFYSLLFPEAIFSLLFIFVEYSKSSCLILFIWSLKYLQ